MRQAGRESGALRVISFRRVLASSLAPVRSLKFSINQVRHGPGRCEFRCRLELPIRVGQVVFEPIKFRQGEMSFDGTRVERKRMLHCVRGGNPIVFPKRKSSKRQMKAGFVARVEAEEPLFGVIKLLLTARCLDQKKHRFLLSGRAFENGQGLLPCLLKFVPPP